jgi:hypothetical protein
LLALFLLAFEKVIKSRGMKSGESNGRADNAWKYYSLLSRSRSTPWRSFYFLQKMRWFLLGSISLRAPWPSHLYCNVDHSLCCDWAAIAADPATLLLFIDRAAIGSCLFKNR